METLDQIQRQLLVLRCQVGDKTAFNKLFERYHGPITYYVRRLLDDVDSAEDVVQEVWIAVLAGIGRLKNPQAFAVWIYRIARNKAMGSMRGRRFPMPLEMEPADEAPSVEDSFFPEEAERIHVCLGRLQTHHREALVLRFMEQMSYDQIASVLCCSIGTVKSRLHHAKRNLRREMENADDDQ